MLDFEKGIWWGFDPFAGQTDEPIVKARGRYE